MCHSIFAVPWKHLLIHPTQFFESLTRKNSKQVPTWLFQVDNNLSPANNDLPSSFPHLKHVPTATIIQNLRFSSTFGTFFAIHAITHAEIHSATLRVVLAFWNYEAGVFIFVFYDPLWQPRLQIHENQHGRLVLRLVAQFTQQWSVLKARNFLAHFSNTVTVCVAFNRGHIYAPPRRSGILTHYHNLVYNLVCCVGWYRLSKHVYVSIKIGLKIRRRCRPRVMQVGTYMHRTFAFCEMSSLTVRSVMA